MSAMDIELLRPRVEGETGPKLDDPRLLDALKKGNIHDVMRSLPAGVTARDIDDYLKAQYRTFQQKLVQGEALYADAAMPPPPALDLHFLPQSIDNAMNAEDEATLSAIVTGKMGVGGKAAATGESETESTSSDGNVMGKEELLQYGTQQLGDIEALNAQLNQQIFEAQLQMEIQKKKGELEKIKQELMRLVKSGADIGIVWAMLAKYVSTENGILMGAKSAEIKQQNELINKATADLQNMTSADPQQFAAQSMVAQNKLREGSQGLQMMMQDMQKLMQNIESWMSTAKSAIDEYNRNKAEMIRKFDVR